MLSNSNQTGTGKTRHNLIFVLNIFCYIVFHRDYLFIPRQQRKQPLIVIIIRRQTFRVCRLCSKSQKSFLYKFFFVVSWYIYIYTNNTYIICTVLGSAHIAHYYYYNSQYRYRSNNNNNASSGKGQYQKRGTWPIYMVVTPLYYILHIYSGPTIVVSLLATVQMVMNQRRFVTFGLCIHLRLRGNPNSLDFTQI